MKNRTHKFKKDDWVTVCKTGAIGWESEDWAETAFGELGISYPNGIVKVEQTQIFAPPALTPNVWIAGFAIHPDHFRLATPEEIALHLIG